MKWVIEKQIELHGKMVDVIVPNPDMPKELAHKRFKELTEEIASLKAS